MSITLSIFLCGFVAAFILSVVRAATSSWFFLFVWFLSFVASVAVMLYLILQ